MQSFKDSIIELIAATSTNLPPDVRARHGPRGRCRRRCDERRHRAAVIANNIDMACDNEGPICQDTGMPTFEIKTPVGANQIVMKREIREAIAEATRRGKLRPNSVDSITGHNSGDNLGPGTPVMHFDQWENDGEIEVKLLLKGGGCENKNIQYSLPAELPHLGRAGRDLDGVRKCILHAVWQAQGQGCSAGAIGVSIGGDRTSGYAARERAALPHARRHEPGRRARGARRVHNEGVKHARHRHDGIRRRRDSDRLQGWRDQPAARELLRVGRLRLLGVSAARRGA